MKKLTFLLLFMLSIAWVACDKDSPTPQANGSELILGKWTLTENVLKGDRIILNECEKKSYLNFKKDGYLTVQFFELDGGQCVPLEIDTAKYELLQNRNLLSFEYVNEDELGEKGVLEILSLGPEKMELGIDGDKAIYIKKE